MLTIYEIRSPRIEKMADDKTYTTMKTAMKMERKPAQVSQPIFWNLRMEAQAVTTTVARNDHQTVQAACSESALRPMETPRIPEPLQRIY